MEKEILGIKLIETIGDYTIVRLRERTVKQNGIIYGKIQTWYDVCLDYGDGDIVCSYNKLSDARKWAKEN